MGAESEQLKRTLALHRLLVHPTSRRWLSNFAPERFGDHMCTEGANNEVNRGLQVAITVLTAFVVGICAGVLSWLAGWPVPAAFLTGGGAILTTIGAILGILHFMRKGS